MLLFWLLSACVEEKACTTIAVSSVMVELVGPDGAPMVGEVKATDEAGNEVQAFCSDTAATGDCSSWVVGMEVVGSIHIEASAFDGCNNGSGFVDVEVPWDEAECHPETQSVTLSIDEWTDMDCNTTG